MKNFKHLILIISFLLANNFIYASEVKSNIVKADTLTLTTQFGPKAVTLKDSIVNFGKLFLGTHYRYGSSGTSSFDCSGFTSFVYNNFGFELPRSSADQAKKFETIDKEDLKPGDLVFFQGRRQNGNVGHVGIVVETKENGEFKFIHASTSEGVTITNSESNYYTKRFVKASRVFDYDSVLLAIGATRFQQKQLSKNSTQETAQELTKKTIPAKYHYVKKGENLTILAKTYGLSIAQLKSLNGIKKNTINIKQRLLIEEEKIVMVAQTKPESTDKATGKQKSMKDSIQSDKKLLVKNHSVEKGETLSSIAKKYNLDIEQIKSLNKIAKDKLAIGQNLQLIDTIRTDKNKEQSIILAQNNAARKDSLIVKDITKKSTEIAKVSNNKTIEANKFEHKIEKGESLYSIAKKYNTSVDELKSINGLTGNYVQLGQKLLVQKKSLAENTSQPDQKNTMHKVEKGETYSSIARKYNCKINDLKQWNNKSGDNLNIGEKLIIKTT